MKIVTILFIPVLGVLFSCANSVELNRKFLPSKIWWAKKVTDDLYVAGRLTYTQYKYASEVGFKTILSNFNHTADEFIGEEITPSTSNASKIAALAGFRFAVILDSGTKWNSAEASLRLAQVYPGAPKPVLYHCYTSYSSLFDSLTYFARLSRSDPNAKPRMRSMDIYSTAATMGFNFTLYPNLRSIISNITGEPIPGNIPRADPPRIPSLWEVQPVLNDWFIGGQIQENYLSKIKSAGIKTIINTRLGVTSPPNKKETQEEVDLLNIKDQTGTYRDGGRQNKTSLEKNRISPDKSTEYISKGSTVNYASRNHLQFGDDVGYNETRERLAVEATGLKYYHLPTEKNGFTLSLFKKYNATLREASKTGPILVHCDSGWRAAVLAVVAAGEMEGRDSAWAIRRCTQLGYTFSKQETPTVIQLFEEVLDKKVSGGPTSKESNLLLLSVLSLITIVWFN